MPRPPRPRGSRRAPKQPNPAPKTAKPSSTTQQIGRFTPRLGRRSRVLETVLSMSWLSKVSSSYVYSVDRWVRLLRRARRRFTSWTPQPVKGCPSGYCPPRLNTVGSPHLFACQRPSNVVPPRAGGAQSVASRMRSAIFSSAASSAASAARRALCVAEMKRVHTHHAMKPATPAMTTYCSMPM